MSAEIIATVSFDPETQEVSLDFHPDFYEQPLKEQKSIIRAIKVVVEDEADEVHDDIIEKLEADVAELQEKLGVVGEAA